MRARTTGSMAGGDFFIVDNSDEHWKALEYVRQWCEISSGVDVATGTFEVGALLALDGAWQKVDKVRILIGAETTRRTKDAIGEARRAVDDALEQARQADPVLGGLAGVVQALRDGRVEVRVYREKKFHAKCYITHSRLDVVGSAALVGSSNFTEPGLTQNVELNVRIDGAEVRELQQWFTGYWNAAEDASDDILQVMERHTRQWTAFEVYARALQVLTANVDPGATEWERESSVVYPRLAPYQREAYHGLKQRASRWGGAFLTDGVGLGKTFVGLMLAEHYAVRERKNVLILATKTGQDAVWEPELRRLLPDLTGEFTNVRVMAHTDLSRDDAAERAARLADRVDVVIIDECHNFRNRGSRGEEDGERMSRWWRLQEITVGKTVFLLSATPINNSLFDFVHQIEVFTGADAQTEFAELGISNLRSYVADLQRVFHEEVEASSGKVGSVTLDDFEALMRNDRLLQSLIVQNSRAYAQQSAEKEESAPVLFPQPDWPRAVPYTYDHAYTRLLKELEKAFEKDRPLFTLPMYYPLAYSRRDDVDKLVENRQQQVVGLIRTTFLKRFESSIAAFAGSCLDLSEKIAQWIIDNADGDNLRPYADQVRGWEQRQAPARNRAVELFRSGMEGDGLDFSAVEATEDVTEEAFEEHAGRDVLDPADYDLQAMFEEAIQDLLQLGTFLERAVTVAEFDDPKYAQLRALLAGGRHRKGLDVDVFDPAYSEQKVLVFTEFADTARYLHDRLADDGVEGVDRIDGTRTVNRVEMIRRFAPFYNRVPPEQRDRQAPLRVLISTDVLSEGVNLQDAALIINYDIHWNPVRLMQRIGRIDRRLDADTEQKLIAHQPSAKAIRGTVRIRNFLPPEELNRLLTLYARVQSRALLISKTLGIPGGRLLNEDDILDDTKVFEAFLDELQGEVSPLESLRLRYQDLTAEHPDLEERLAAMPKAIGTAKSGSPTGMFICSVEPMRAEDGAAENGAWTVAEGAPRWVLHLPGDDEPRTDVTEIDTAIRCEPDTPSKPLTDPAQARATIVEAAKQRHVELMKTSRLPLDAPRPETICWMEIR